ncbi:Tectonin beta-propeller repeat-containing protein 2 [Orchesella cincta]|uniref:Tectonin beta-propeller repeat-containing protein 2 n=1 Tax=Orchesella cincta TaxID=48709 RepID=A0A1D2MX83_ORCCI|nr:Tectonin beta-propeller repeat-containing protein 2 [Orchesella cincta]
MSNGMDTENNVVEEAEELLKSQEESQPSVHCIRIDVSEVSFPDDGIYSEQSSATATPLERSQEVAQDKLRLEDALAVAPKTVSLKEWSTLINLLARIPVKAQKGLSSMDLKLTCISTISGSEEILVIGTNVGIVYWYNRKTDVLDRLRCEGLYAVTSLNCICTVDYMVAAGNQAGIVTIFQIPRDPSQDNKTSAPSDFYDRKTKKSQRFLVQELHRGAVTALEWSRNGMKLFSGDQTGHIVLTDIDYDLVQIRSSVLLCENYEIVQLSYARRNLLICSTFRSIIYSLESKSFNKVGSLERKMMGKFGGLIVSSAWEESPKVYSVRPGGRLWVANLSGVVQHTIKFKELLVSGSQPEITVIKPPKTTLRSPQEDIQFSRVFRFMKDYLVTYHKDILHVMDARNTVVLGTCQQLRSILDVAVNKDEIFILESSRNVIRISAKPDKFASSNLFNIYSSISTNSNTNNNTFPEDFSSGFKNIPDIMSASISDFRFPQEPINFLTSKFKETSTKVMPKINSTINTIKTVIEADVDIEDGQKLFGDGITPGVVALDDSDLPYLDLLSSPPQESQPVFVPEPERFQKITNLPFEDVVVEAKPKRKKGMKRKGDLAASKKEGSSDVASDSLSVSSVYSNASTGSDNNVNATGVAVATSSSSTSSSARKLSVKSDATLSSSNSGSEGVPSTSSESKDQLGIPLSLSQSWTIGTLLPNKTVTTEELHLKEELLARRLKWPELLPDSVSADGLFDDFPGVNSMGLSEENNCWQVNLNKREDRASIATLVGTYNPLSSDGDDTDSRTLSMENGSSLGTVIERKIVRNEEAQKVAIEGDEKTQKDTQEDDSDSSEFDEDRYYVDIYTRYRNTDSFSSVLSYGPPSGSSYQSANRVPINTNTTTAPNGNDEVEKAEEKSKSIGSLPLPLSTTTASEELDNSKEHSVDTVTTSSSVEEVDSIVESKVFTDEHWRRWRLPGSSSISQITMCDHYIICVSCKGIVYYAMLDTIGLDWKSTNYSASAIAVSPCGTVFWRIHKGDLYSLRNLAENCPVAKEGGEEWSKLTQKRDVLTATVQKSFGWVVKTDGLLEFCTGLFETKLVPYFEKVYTPWPIQEVACCGHKLWALTSDGRIVLRTGTSDLNPKGVDWVELKWSIKVAPACSISCGVVREDGVPSVWFADSNSNLYFTFDEKDARGEWTPWKVSVSNCVVYPVAPTKSVLLNSIKEQVSRSFKSLVQTKSALALCSSKNSVWFAAPESLIIYGNRNSITGHCWKPLRIDRGMTAPSTWTNIYANSVYKGHGNLWITDSSGYLYYLPPGGGKLQQIDLPMFTEGQIINVAPAPEALWALTSTGDIYGRCSISSMDAIGKDWRQISMCTSKSSQIVHVSCGSEVAWAVDDRGEVYMMVGSLRPPGAQDMSPAWVKVESSVCCKGVFNKVYVGANDSMVWALDNKKRVYVRQAVFPECRIGTGWLLVKGIDAVMLSISDSGVWALSSNGDLYRRYGITKTNFVGDYWRKTPGAATSLAVSLCDELWALNAEGYLLKHSKKSMEFVRGGDGASSSRSPSRIVLDEEDEDWELVDNPEF